MGNIRIRWTRWLRVCDWNHKFAVGKLMVPKIIIISSRSVTETTDKSIFRIARESFRLFRNTSVVGGFLTLPTNQQILRMPESIETMSRVSRATAERVFRGGKFAQLPPLL